MSKKRRRTGGRNRAGLDHLQIARRELAKRNAKTSLRHARLASKKSSAEEVREVLQQALLARAQQLYERGNPDLARPMIDELTSLGETIPELAVPLTRLCVLLGLAGPLNAKDAGLAELPEELANCVADEAVLRPQRRSACYAELNAQADQIREGLRALEQGDDAAARKCLEAIPRQSPLADWKLFVRGLAAHYAEDAERANANWERLDPQRPASRIASQLLVFSERRKPAECDFDVATGQRRLHHAVAGHPAIIHLQDLCGHLQSGRLREAFETLAIFRQRHGQTHRRLLQRISEILGKRFVHEDDYGSLSKLTRVIPGPPLDPRWNRATAMILEQAEEQDLNRLEELWLGYIQDLRQCPELNDQERRIAVALVYCRLAGGFAGLAVSEHEPEPWLDDDDTKERDEWLTEVRSLARKYFGEAIRAYPQLLKAHRQRLSFLRAIDRPEDAVLAAAQLLEQFPEDFATLIWLGDHFVESDRPAEATPYLDQAKRLRPRDPGTQSLIWHQRLGLLRQSTRRRKFDDARRQLQEALADPPGHVLPYVFDVLRATIEYKAKNIAAAEDYLRAAERLLEEPTVIWMRMHANADRYGLPAKLKARFRKNLESALTARCTSQTAGQMAQFLSGYLAREVNYVGLTMHQRLLVGYLNRAQRVAWERSDLRSVCIFLRLEGRPSNQMLRDAIYAKGCKLFPREPLFRLLAASAEMDKGPHRGDFDRAKENFELALELNASADTPLSEEDAQLARQGLDVIHATEELRARFFGGFAAMMGQMLGWDDEDEDEDWDDEDDDWDDEDEDDEGWRPSGQAEDPHGNAEDPTRSTQQRRRRNASRSSAGQRYFDFD